MKMLNERPIDYAGDGIYVMVDKYGIWLHANHHKFPTDKIYIDNTTLKSILKIREDGIAYLKKKEEG